MRTVTLPGVMRPLSDCWLLAAAMREHQLARGAKVLDLFTGTGALAVTAAHQGARVVVAVDISLTAALNAKLNGWLNGARVRVLRGDLFDPVRGERFDLILANPPYVPSEGDALPGRGISRAWEGGRDGRAVLDRLCAEAASHLRPRGSILIVHSSISIERRTIELLEAAGLEAYVVTRQRGPLGPILRSRATMLEERGLLPAGDREEDLVVIRGTN